MKIVIVDDSIVIRQRLVRQLRELDGIEVVGEANDVPVARKLVEKLKPDVAVLDIRMPSGSGADLVQELKQLKPAPTVIMLTNYPYPENRKKCMALGADFFFDKSTEFQEAVRLLGRMATGSCGT